MQRVLRVEQRGDDRRVKDDVREAARRGGLEDGGRQRGLELGERRVLGGGRHRDGGRALLGGDGGRAADGHELGVRGHGWERQTDSLIWDQLIVVDGATAGALRDDATPPPRNFQQKFFG